MSRAERITTSATRPNPRYSDIVTGFSPHPLTGDVGRLTEDDAIRASIINCVMTRFKEVPYQPYFGSAVLSTLFDNSTDDAFVLLNTTLEQALQQEPRVQFISSIVSGYDTNEFRVSVLYQIVTTGESSSVDVLLRRVR